MSFECEQRLGKGEWREERGGKWGYERQKMKKKRERLRNETVFFFVVGGGRFCFVFFFVRK